MCFVAVTWQGQECRFTLHYDNGFTLTDSRGTQDTRKPKIMWHFPYEKLRMSADDSNRLLWLDFGEDGEQVTIVTVLPATMATGYGWLYYFESFTATK